jgi:hypothetical protein
VGEWYARGDSNPRPLPPQGSALSTELLALGSAEYTTAVTTPTSRAATVDRRPGADEGRTNEPPMIGGSAEGEGFEPSAQGYPGSRLAGGCTRPLCDPSKRASYSVVECGGGGGGIRTPGAGSPAVFKTAALNRSATPPLPKRPHVSKYTVPAVPPQGEAGRNSPTAPGRRARKCTTTRGRPDG